MGTVINPTDSALGTPSTAEELRALSWVQDEVRRSLEAGHKVLHRYVKEAEALRGSDVDQVDPTVLRHARTHFHQAAGALELVGMPVPAMMMRASEKAIQRLSERPSALTAKAVETIERASFALLDYIARLTAGKAVSGVALFPQYQGLLELAGADRIHPADLWSHDWAWRVIPRDPDARAIAMDTPAREAMERLILRLMRSPDRVSLQRMSDLCAGLGADAKGRRATLWQLAAGVFEAQAAGLLKPDVHVKRVAPRLLAQARLGLRSGDVSDRLANDLLFFCARAAIPAHAQDAPRLSAVRQAYRLDAVSLPDYDAPSLGRFDPGQLAQARKRVATARDAWNAMAAGEAPRGASVSDSFALLHDSLERLYPDGAELGRALMGAAGLAGPAGVSGPVAMEVATAILYLEASLEDAEFDDPRLASRIRRLAQRIDTVRDGAPPAPLEPWMEELYRRVSDSQTIGSVVQELRGVLGDIEKQLDQFSRQPQQPDVLAPVPGQLGSLLGVMSVLGLDAATQGVQCMRDDVDALMQSPATAPGGLQGLLDRLAENLGALTFLLDILGVQPQLAKSLFTFEEDTGRLRALMAAPAPRDSGWVDAIPDTGPGDLGEWAQRVGRDAVRADISDDVLTREMRSLAQQALLAEERRLADALTAAQAALQRTSDPDQRRILREELALRMQQLAGTTGTVRPMINLPAPAAEGAPPAAPLMPAAAPRVTAPAGLAAGPAASGPAIPAIPALAAGAATLAAGAAAAAAPTTPTTPDLAIPAGAAEAATDETLDADAAEMRAVFLEEAAEVIDGARPALQRLSTDGRDADGDLPDMTALRRAFHTLKGSSRMVGLTAYGEAAWACEQLYNARLAHSPQMDAPLRSFTTQALDYLDTWTQAVAARRDGGHRAEPVIQAAEALRLEGRLLPLGLPTAPVAEAAPSPMVAAVPAAATAAAAAASSDGAALAQTPEPAAQAAGERDATEPAVPALAEPATPSPAVDATLRPDADAVPSMAPLAPLALTPVATPAPIEAWVPEAPLPSIGPIASDETDLAAPAVPTLPSEPALPTVPAWPALGDVPEVPDAAALPEVTELPAPPAFDWPSLPALDLDGPAPPASVVARDPEPGLQPIVEPSLPSIDGLADAAEPASADTADVEPDAVKVIGPLRIDIGMFNIYLNEADERARSLSTQLAEWAVDPQVPPGEDVVVTSHALAGSSATVGFDGLAALARALEHALMRSNEAGVVSPGETGLYQETAENITRLLHQFAAGFLEAPKAGLLERLELHQPAAPLPTLVDEVPAEAPEDLSLPAAASAALAVAPIVAAPLSGASGETTLPHEAPAATAAEAAPAAETAADSGWPAEDELDAVDAVDAELFPVFAEEAEELLPRLQGHMREWTERPQERAAAAACMRALHTFKGGARLAGAMRLGEMAHRTESAVEQLLASPGIGAADVEQLATRVDAIDGAFTALRAKEEARQAVPTVAARPLPAAAMAPLSAAGALGAAATGAAAAGAVEIAGPADAADATTAPSPLDEPAAADDVLQTIDWTRFRRAEVAIAPDAQAAMAAAAAGAVRVKSSLLDKLVSHAGEVSIARTRIEADLVQFKTGLADLSENLDRLRRQLRDVEVQAESQISSRLEAAKAASVDFDPLEMDRYTRVQELTRMMAESVNDVATVQRSLQRALQSSEDQAAQQGRLTRTLQDDLLRTRMVEFESLSDRLYRVVRLAAKETGKQVRLDIVGGSIEVDRSVLERMTAPFEHLLRNAVTHGIEDPAARQAAGKPPVGTIEIRLEPDGNEVAVEFADDGRGLDLARIRQRALDKGLLARDAQASDEALADLIFAPGFSTAETVTELAGRGVGMDVVRSEVLAMGGRVQTQTRAGQGTRFRMVLPLTTAVTQVVMLRCGERKVAVPSNLIEIVRREPSSDVEAAYARGTWTLNGQEIPFHWLAGLLDDTPAGAVVGRSVPVVIVRSAAQRVALHVDEVLGNQEVVVKNLGAQLSRLPGLSGITLLPSGAVAAIYNPVALAAWYGEATLRRLRALRAGALTGRGGSAATAAAAPAPLVLVVDDSLTVRRVTQRLMLREGYRVVTAKDGLDALERIGEERPAVILSDIEMPRMDGFDFVRNLRSDPALASLPVIMITSRIAQKHRDYALELGVQHYLGKPYGEDELLGLVARYARRDAPAVQPAALA